DDTADYPAHDTAHVTADHAAHVTAHVTADHAADHAAHVTADDTAFVLGRIHAGALTRASAAIAPLLVTASPPEVTAVALRVASRASPAHAASAGLTPLVTLAGVPRLPWAANTAVEMAMAKTPPRRCAM